MSGFTFDELMGYFYFTSREMLSEHVATIRNDPLLPDLVRETASVFERAPFFPKGYIEVRGLKEVYLRYGPRRFQRHQFETNCGDSAFNSIRYVS